MGAGTVKSHQRTRPPLGYPRETDSLCPRCVIETRNAIIRGERELGELVQGHPGEIRARLVEEEGRVLIRKRCERPGEFEDVLSIDAEFNRVIEGRYPGRDFRTLGDQLVHRHGRLAETGHPPLQVLRDRRRLFFGSGNTLVKKLALEALLREIPKTDLDRGVV